MNSRRSVFSTWNRLYRKIDNGGVCVYCGVPATTQDHFLPLSVMSALADIVDHVHGRFVVPSCGQCNSIAGSTPFRSVGAKRRYIQGRLKWKYRKLLSSPRWDPEEIAELGYSLRTVIEGAEIKRQWIEHRISWRNRDNASAVSIAEIRMKFIGGGSGSARPPAKPMRTRKRGALRWKNTEAAGPSHE